MTTSYICEHTSEYYLVPALQEILNSKFKFVAPVFPWLSRETSKISRRLHKNDRFHVLVMFPRRPKLNSDCKNDIYVTMNWELSEFKKVGDNNGVTVIAGCPKATNFWSLANSKKFVWINISSPDLSEHLNLLNNIGSSFLTEKDIIAMVEQSSIFDLETFECFIRKVKKSQPNRMYGGQYKPVYFLIKTH